MNLLLLPAYTVVGCMAEPPINDTNHNQQQKPWINPYPIKPGWEIAGQEPLLDFDRHDDATRITMPDGSSLSVDIYEVTQARYQTVIGVNPSASRACHDKHGRQWIRPDYPVTCTYFADVVTFANALSERDDLQPVYQVVDQEIQQLPDANGYRIPKVAEWEYLARAGATGSVDSWCYPIRDPGHPFQYDPSTPIPTQCTGPGRIRRVGAHAKNGFGLYQMSGNAAELAGEPDALVAVGNGATAQGGHFDHHYPTSDDYNAPIMGFRLVRSVGGPSLQP